MEVQELKVKSFVTKYNKEKKALISILQNIQEEYNYLPQEALRIVSETLNVPLIDIIGVATFYRAFSLEPRGKHLVTVCMGTACHVRGAPMILDEFQRRLGIEAGQTSEDKKFTLETVNCVGACALGPIAIVDGEYHGQLKTQEVQKILKGIDGKDG